MLLVIIIVKGLLPSNASGEHISVHAHAIGWHLFAPLPRIIALFSTCVSVNFYPLRELDTIESGSMDLIITYSGLPPNLIRCTSSQILLLATFHCQVLQETSLFETSIFIFVNLSARPFRMLSSICYLGPQEPKLSRAWLCNK